MKTEYIILRGLRRFAPEPDTRERKRFEAECEPANETETSLVARTVKEACQNNPQALVRPQNRPSLPVRAMLGLLTYCYVKGIFSSSDIERRLWEDTRIRMACPGDIPEAHTIRKFRRLNREVILSTLEQALKTIWRTLGKPWRKSSAAPAGTPDVACTRPLSRDGDTTEMARQDALHRLENAAIYDNALSDD